MQHNYEIETRNVLLMNRKYVNNNNLYQKMKNQNLESIELKKRQTEFDMLRLS